MAAKKHRHLTVVYNHLPAWTKKTAAVAARVIQRTAFAIEQDVKGQGPHAAPYRTGNLRRSYVSRRIGDLAWVVENDPQIAPYAIYVEFGTRKMAARPHLGPAATYHGQQIPQLFKEELQS